MASSDPSGIPLARSLFWVGLLLAVSALLGAAWLLTADRRAEPVADKTLVLELQQPIAPPAAASHDGDPCAMTGSSLLVRQDDQVVLERDISEGKLEHLAQTGAWECRTEATVLLEGDGAVTIWQDDQMVLTIAWDDLSSGFPNPVPWPNGAGTGTPDVRATPASSGVQAD